MIWLLACGLRRWFLNRWLTRRNRRLRLSRLNRLYGAKLHARDRRAVFRSAIRSKGRAGTNERQYGAENIQSGIATHGTLLTPPILF